jgi:hypothetical protein
VAEGGAQLSQEEFFRRYPQLRPSAGDVEQVTGNYQRERDFNLAYAAARQRGLSHEASTWAAQELVYGKRRSRGVGAETAENAAVAQMPLSSPLPAVQAAVAQMEAGRVPVGGSGRRMALRYGLPALGVLLGLYGLEALDRDERLEPAAGAVA